MALIDKFAPAWQFRETHRIGVLAPAGAVERAIREVTVREIKWLRTLMRLRGYKLPADEPILNVMLRHEFELLADDPREIVLGRTRPKTVRAVMNFRIDARQLALCMLTTETRVITDDARTQRNFALYWWTIRLGSGLIRRMWLRAIRRRAEKMGS